MRATLFSAVFATLNPTRSSSLTRRTKNGQLRADSLLARIQTAPLKTTTTTSPHKFGANSFGASQPRFMSLFVSRRLLHRCLPVAFSSVFTNLDIKMPSFTEDTSPQAATGANGDTNGGTNGAGNDTNAAPAVETSPVPAKRARVSAIQSKIRNVIVPYVKAHEKARPPHLGSDEAAGQDLHSVENVIIPAGGQALVNTGLKIALPEKTYGRIAPRSGLALKHQIDVGAGVVDNDYRGEVKVLLFNRGKEDFPVKENDRIAQLIVQEIATPDCKPVVPETEFVQFRLMREKVKKPTLDFDGVVVYSDEDGVVPAKGMHAFSTGIQVALPQGYYGHASPLTDLAVNHGIDLYAGVIDSDYRGELKVLLSNNSDEDFTVKAGDAVMQILVEKIAHATYKEVSELPTTNRGDGGFGSTGFKNPNAVDAENVAALAQADAENIAAHATESEKEEAYYRPNIHEVKTDRAVNFFPVDPEAHVPMYGSDYAAGGDLYALKNTIIPAGGRGLVNTGTVAIVAPGYYARIAPRSGLAVKHGIDVGAGVEYTSREGTTINVLLFNFGTEEFVVKRGERIAQVISERIAIPCLKQVDNLPESGRGENGFGSTGVEAVPAPSAVPEGDATPVEQVQAQEA